VFTLFPSVFTLLPLFCVSLSVCFTLCVFTLCVCSFSVCVLCVCSLCVFTLCVSPSVFPPLCSLCVPPLCSFCHDNNSRRKEKAPNRNEQISAQPQCYPIPFPLWSWHLHRYRWRSFIYYPFEASLALARDEVPVGCVFVDGETQQVLGSAHNMTTRDHNATRHCELVVPFFSLISV